MPTLGALTESSILAQVIASHGATLNPEAARFLLTRTFDRHTTRMIRQLLARNNRGTITVDERLALQKYLRIGHLLDLLHAQARLVLATSADGN